MDIDLVLKRLELIKEGKGIGTISEIEASIILNEIERLKSNEKTLADLLDKEQKKNKKAIEYINKNQKGYVELLGCTIPIQELFTTNIELLNILKGEDKE